MTAALAIGVCIGALWALLLLLTIVRLRDPLGHVRYRELVFEPYRVQHERLQRATSVFATTNFLAVFCAVMLGHLWPLVIATAASAYLITGIVHVMRSIESMRFLEQDDDPCWQALALALGWPMWAPAAERLKSR